MSKSHRLAWAAGFIDGDGFITIQKRNQTVNGKQYKGHYLRVGACQANKTPLEELQSLFGGNISPKNTGKSSYNRKPQWMWCVSTATANQVLLQLLPFLIHKKEVALLAIKFQATMGTTNKVTEDVFELREQLKTEIQRLNSLS